MPTHLEYLAIFIRYQVEIAAMQLMAWILLCRVESVVKESLFATRLGKTTVQIVGYLVLIHVPISLLITMACVGSAAHR